MKGLPKGMLLFIALLFLILIPLILSLLLVGGILKLTGKALTALLPFRKNKAIKNSSNSEYPITIDITPKQ